MLPWLAKFLIAFIPLFVAIDPIGLVPMYLSLAANVDARQRRRATREAVVTAFLVGLCFLFLGRLIFSALGITVADFRIAGGIILLVIAVQELVTSETPTRVPNRD